MVTSRTEWNALVPTSLSVLSDQIERHRRRGGWLERRLLICGDDPFDREDKLRRITGRSGKFEWFLGRLDGYSRNVGGQLQINRSLLEPATPQNSVDFPARTGWFEACLSHGEVAVRAQHVDEITVPQGMVQQSAVFDGTQWRCADDTDDRNPFSIGPGHTSDSTEFGNTGVISE